MASNRQKKALAEARAAAARAFAKKTRLAMPSDQRTEIEIAGKKLTGRVARFTTDGEATVTCTLDDGTRIRIRLLIEDIVVTDKELSPGVPIIATRHTVLVTQAPPLLKK